MLLMAYVDLNKTSREDMWFLDSGCNNHMCGKKDYFSDFDGTFRDSVKLGNNMSMSVLGKGNVRLKVNEMTQIITGVFYVLELKNNLLSIGQLQEKWLTILFQHGKCKVFHSQKVIEDILQLWHCRYGHLSFKGLKTLQQRKMVNGFPQFQPPSKLCKDCLVGNNTGLQFQRKATGELLKFYIQNKTPEKAWGKLKPSVDYFRVFGCISHVHVPDSKRTKLDDKSFSCVLLGVSEESKAYKLYDPISQKIIISRDVVFEEDKNWDWDKKYEEAIVCDLEWGDDGEEATVNEEESDSNLDADIEEDTEENNATAIAVEFDAAVTAFDLLIQNRDTPSNSNAARNRRPPVWTSDYETGEELSEEEHEVQLAMFAAVDPIYFEEAVKRRKTIGVKWVYKTKFNENGEVEKHKARLVAKGYTQRFGVDYTEVFAPVARMETIRLVVALAAQREWSIYQLDVKSAFLHGELNEEVFVEQPCGYVQKGNEKKVYKLNKALYGLKQAPHAWYSRIEAYFMTEVFEKCDYEHTLFIKTNKKGKVLIVSLYVDDLIFTGNDELMFAEFKHSMKHEFDMTDLGKMRYFLGLEVLQKSDGIFISQKKYALEVLNIFGMDKSNSVFNPIVPGCKLVKDEGGVKGGDDELVAYTDSDYAGDLEDQKSTSGYVFLLSSGAISWSSKKQPVVSLSTTEAEFIAATSCACQAVWLKRVLGKLDQNQSRSCVIQCDSSAAIKLSKNPVMHGRSKHIDVHFHFLRDLTKDGSVEFEYCDTQEQLADIMTKPLKLNTFVRL
ncbi:Retrovirus-related Pol polyprotein from transposon TNT 1-94 [Vitis vinifera]|uniref:Retrovirus-related Pol polyprotein from transposon TNT 1-94 n=1 Tax=Vitis vinifera TaxID=29760 RepID=A0A438I4A4_VITVI|nr:Retrovirus-related Pol polyprotein from transposon TNT 1-94 [Vitis vinifera]